MSIAAMPGPAPFTVFLVFLITLPFARATSKVPGIFVFGDSVLDPGNNDYVSTSLTKADFKPYGCDFILGPTGRYTNGNNPGDILGKLLELPLVPPFLSPAAQGANVTRGINYASAGSGVLDNTNSRLRATSCISLSQQVTYFKNETVPQLASYFNNSTDDLGAVLSKSIYLVNAGANDIEAWCFDSGATTTISCDLSEWTQYIIHYLSTQIKRIYELGARKFVLFGVQVIGCSPLTREKSGDGECIENFNTVAKYYNKFLRASIDDLKTNMSGAYFVYFDAYMVVESVLDDPTILGLKNTTGACCELASSGFTCEEDGDVCSDRDTFAYFDGVHPTQILYNYITETAFTSENQTLVYPYNVTHLASLSVESNPLISLRSSVRGTNLQ